MIWETLRSDILEKKQLNNGFDRTVRTFSFVFAGILFNRNSHLD